MSAANYYNDDGLDIFNPNEFKSDNYEYSSAPQMNYPYFPLDKNLVMDPTMDGPSFPNYTTVNGIDYLNPDLDNGANLLMNGSELVGGVMVDPVKPYNGEYVNCESFSTRYTDGSFDQNNPNNNLTLNYNMDSLTESMLKQLDTPKLFSQAESEVPDSLHLNSLDPQIIKRLYDAGINVNPETRDDYYDPSMDYFDSYGSDLDPSKRDRFRTRRRGRRPDELKTGSTIKMDGYKSPTLKGASKPRNGSKSSFSTLNYSWLKDSFFNCQILGNVVSIAQDQTGCRMLQRQLECNDYQFISSVLTEVLDNLYMLMTDPFGNYLCQKLMSVCDSEQLGMIITACEPQFISICLNMHGTRAIQKLIEVVTDSNITRITSILSTGVVELVNDLNGNHVIQKCLVSLSSNHCEFIYKAMNENCVYLATHRHGCCVMQRCIDAASPAQRAQLVDTISSKTLELVEDAYGNYVIQYVLRLKDDAINSRIVSFLCEDVTKYAKQKFSSNVVERCLIFCPLEVRSTLISKFLNVPFDVLKDLILDPFANYVIQRVLNVAQPDELTALLDRIQPHLEELKVASSGKRIAAKISRRSNNGSGGPGNSYGSGSSGLNSNINPFHQSTSSMYDMLSESADDQSAYPGYLSNEYPSLSSNSVVSSGSSSQGDKSDPKHDQGYTMKKDRDFLIDLINRNNSNGTSEVNQEFSDAISQTSGSAGFSDFPSKDGLGVDFGVGHNHYDQNDPLVRDFCEIFDGSYEPYETNPYADKLWTSNL